MKRERREGIVLVQFSATRGRVASHKCDAKKGEGCVYVYTQGGTF